MLKKSKGQMYDWVTHMHSHLAGECPHKCGYCYVQTNPHGVSPRYQGAPRLVEEELNVNYGIGKTIFIEHMGDLFAQGILPEWIIKILEHCNRFPFNVYIFQTKNPERAGCYRDKFPPNYKIGTTIETNRKYKDTQAPLPQLRYEGIKFFHAHPVFVTIEPIMDFDPEILASWIIDIQPEFVNIGADSKRCGLPEPSPAKIKELISKLQSNGIIIKKKINLDRILNAK